MIADEHALSREAICLWLMRVLPGATVFEVASVHEKFALRPDLLTLILFALRQPYQKSFTMLQDLRHRFPYTPLVLMSDVMDARILTVARAHGVSGLFHTSDGTEDLMAVMRHALEGKPVFPMAMCNVGNQGDSRFSPRQAEVLELLCEGKSNKEIAALLNMSDNTVRTHVSAIFTKLGVRNRTEAVISGRNLIR